MRVFDKVQTIFAQAKQADFRKLQTLQATCNSSSAFVAAVAKYQSYQKLLQKAFLLSRTWQKLGQARTWKITLKALAMALKALAAGFKRLAEVFELPLSLQKRINKIISSTDFQMALAL